MQNNLDKLNTSNPAQGMRTIRDYVDTLITRDQDSHLDTSRIQTAFDFSIEVLESTNIDTNIHGQAAYILQQISDYSFLYALGVDNSNDEKFNTLREIIPPEKAKNYLEVILKIDLGTFDPLRAQWLTSTAITLIGLIPEEEITSRDLDTIDSLLDNLLSQDGFLQNQISAVSVLTGTDELGINLPAAVVDEKHRKKLKDIAESTTSKILHSVLHKKLKITHIANNLVRQKILENMTKRFDNSLSPHIEKQLRNWFENFYHKTGHRNEGLLANPSMLETIDAVFPEKEV